jgi:hypothetical protein
VVKVSVIGNNNEFSFLNKYGKEMKQVNRINKFAKFCGVVTIKDWKVKIRNNKLASKERFF